MPLEPTSTHLGVGALLAAPSIEGPSECRMTRIKVNVSVVLIKKGNDDAEDDDDGDDDDEDNEEEVVGMTEVCECVIEVLLSFPPVKVVLSRCPP